MSGSVNSGYERLFDIPIGPQHPALKEPALITLKVEGEHVVGVGLDVSYNHRGIEKAAEYRTYVQNLYLIERICGICNVAHTLTFTQCVEGVQLKDAPERAKMLRVLVEELARIHSHLLWLGVAAHEIGFDTFFMYIWLDREVSLDLMEAFTGNRITSAYNIIGGVRRDLTPEITAKIRKGMDRLEERAKFYRKIVETEKTVISRTQSIGILPPEDAIRLSAVGPTLRASGIKIDARADDPYAAHASVPFNVITCDGCDSFSRILVRIDEIVESINIIRYCLEHLPSGPIINRLPRRVPAGEFISRVEAPRGELMHYLRSDGSDKPYRYKVKTPTISNLPSLVHMLSSKGRYVVNIADVPVILASIDPCFSCTARLEKNIGTYGKS
ncbi:MAG: nickel-dependent hydrogenase large subunit [Candidatus Methanomethylicus sp.]|nr:nickel-dependent hydrogenase large subunit [Candidatus Methanomethylicus sp.]